MESLHDNGNQNSTAAANEARDLRCLPSLCRGIYNRVAVKLGCDPSYVSRVARGERKSEAISEALRLEIQAAWAQVNAQVNEGLTGSPEKMLKRKTKAVSA
jgi:hypothetical protein